MPALSVSDVHADYEGTLNPIGKGEVNVSYLVKNTGNVDLGLTQSVAVTGLFGSKAHASLTGVPLLLVGTSVQEHVVVPGVWPQFRVKAAVTVVPHLPAGSGVNAPAPVTTSTSTWAIPWPLIVLVVLLVLFGFGIYRVRARRRAKAAEALAGPPPARQQVVKV